ncbi:MAG: DUF6335 family protein [Thainema sp.]
MYSPKVFMVNQPNRLDDSTHTAQDELLDQEIEISDSDRPVSRSELSDRNIGTGERVNRTTKTRATGSVPTAGDIDANAYQAQVVGEEAVGGTTPTPDQDSTEALAEAAGIEVRDRKPIQTRDDLERRDQNRWQLDPDSAADH